MPLILEAQDKKLDPLWDRWLKVKVLYEDMSKEELLKLNILDPHNRYRISSDDCPVCKFTNAIRINDDIGLCLFCRNRLEDLKRKIYLLISDCPNFEKRSEK